jgi:hypothetical protein
MRLHPDAVEVVVLGLGVIALYLASAWARRVRDAEAAQAEYDRRRAEAVLRALEASRER